MTNSVIVVGLDALVADMTSSAPRLAANAATAVAVNCRKIQQSARARVRGHRHLPQYPNSITYDVRRAPFAVEGEIGPDKSRRQGPLGNIIEYGTSNNAPIEHLGPALEENADDLVRGIEIAVAQALM